MPGAVAAALSGLSGTGSDLLRTSAEGTAPGHVRDRLPMATRDRAVRGSA